MVKAMTARRDGVLVMKT